MTTAIDQATLDDLEHVAVLFDGYRQFYKQPGDLTAARTFVRERIERDESVILLARHAGEPAGFTQLYPIFSSVSMIRSWLLNDLFVHPDHRRLGIARALMQAAIEHAHATGYSRVQLETASDNRPAKRLYESLRFTTSGGFDQYVLNIGG